MKKVFFIPIFLATQMLTSCFFYGTDDDVVIVDPIDYSSYEPVTINRVDFENSIELQEPIDILVSGKIYVKGNLLFINELRKGFHIYDNSDPLKPVPLRFMNVPGSTDLAIRNSTLYINQATDLIAVSFNESLQEVSVTKRIKDVFPILISPDGFYPTGIGKDEIVVDWTLQTKQISIR